MAINPELITTIRVDQLPDETLSLTNLFPHTVGTDLKSATIQELVDLVATSIGVSGGVGYLAISVTDGQQLPDVPELPGFFLCGAGTYLNINGYPNVICTDELNAVMSLTDHWQLAVGIPIVAEVGVQSVTGSAVDNTDPLNPVINEIIFGVQNIIAGTNIAVDDTDPANPIISATGGGGTQNLQQVTDEGNETTNDVIVKNSENKLLLQPRSIRFEDIDQEGSTILRFEDTDVLDQEVFIRGLGGTMALTSDITTPTLSEVLNENNETDGNNIAISDGDAIILDNGANLKKGTTDAGLGGSKGIALRCAVDYELKWEAGRLYVMGGDGFTIREVSHNFTTTPTLNDDDTKGFVVDSRWILDNGHIYICTDNTTGAAAWEFKGSGNTPSIQEVLTDGGDTAEDNAIYFTNTANDFETTINQYGDGQILFSSVINDGGTSVGAGSIYVGNLSGSGVFITKDKITVDSIDYPFPSGASSPLATLADITGGGGVPYTGATQDVDLGTHSITAKNLIVTHSSGSGDAATITKGGSGEALKVLKTSGSGNAASITGGVTLLDELHLNTDLVDAYIASASVWNAKQNALSYTPYKNIQTSQTVHTGTTLETNIFTATIPAGAFNSNDIIKVLFGINKSTSLAGYTLRLRLSTTNNPLGGTLIAIFTGGTGTASAIMTRNFSLNGGNLYGASFPTTIITDQVATNILSSTALNPANQFFIHANISLANVSDSIIGTMLSIHN